MKRLSDMRHQRERSVLDRCRGWTRTLDFQRRVDQSRAAISTWLESVDRPVVSVSGGKDSTLLLMMVREQCPEAVAIMADPPNPLPDRAEHVQALQDAAGGEWEHVPYPWDVEAVLRGERPYPAMLKVRRLIETMRDMGVDGTALGVRANESRARAMHVRLRGLNYRRSDDLRVCQPLAHWPAEMVIGAILAADSLPLNPVYCKLSRAPDNFEHLRDGTWWPVHAGSQRQWLAVHYPEVLDDFDRAVIVGARSHDEF